MVSARLCTASLKRELEPEIKYPMNLNTAIQALPLRAKTTDVVPAIAPFDFIYIETIITSPKTGSIL